MRREKKTTIEHKLIDGNIQLKLPSCWTKIASLRFFLFGFSLLATFFGDSFGAATMDAATISIGVIIWASTASLATVALFSGALVGAGELSFFEFLPDIQRKKNSKSINRFFECTWVINITWVMTQNHCVLNPKLTFFIFLIDTANWLIAMFLYFQIIFWMNFVKMVQGLDGSIGWWGWFCSCCRLIDKNTRSWRFWCACLSYWVYFSSRQLTLCK